MRTLDEEIALHLKEAAESGELGRAKGYGKPLPEDPGWESTPEALRMPMKILKDAGITPPEIEWFHETTRLKVSIDAAIDPTERRALQVQLIQLEQRIALRLEALRINPTL